MSAAYRADRINDKMWIVKRFKDRETVPENFTNADYDEVQVNISTSDRFKAAEASIPQFAAYDAYIQQRMKEDKA